MVTEVPLSCLLILVCEFHSSENELMTSPFARFRLLDCSWIHCCLGERLLPGLATMCLDKKSSRLLGWGDKKVSSVLVLALTCSFGASVT